MNKTMDTTSTELQSTFYKLGSSLSATPPQVDLAGSMTNH